MRDDAVGDGLSARERGTLIHEALAVALSGTRARFGSAIWHSSSKKRWRAPRPSCTRRSAASLRGAALGAALEDVAALLRWSFANSDGIWFAEAERAFGNGEEWSALPVGPHFVSGRIDRIDSNSDGGSVRVIDYKNGLGAPHRRARRPVATTLVVRAKSGRTVRAQRASAPATPQLAAPKARMESGARSQRAPTRPRSATSCCAPRR